VNNVCGFYVICVFYVICIRNLWAVVAVSGRGVLEVSLVICRCSDDCRRVLDVCLIGVLRLSAVDSMLYMYFLNYMHE
jgi:hypothetical protein